MGLAYLTGDRGGCHQRCYPIGHESAGSSPLGPLGDGHTIEGKGRVVAWEQNMVAGFYSLVVCDFGRSGITTGTYLEMLAGATGIHLDEAGLTETGERTWNLIRLFNLREGWTQDTRLPERFKEPLPSGVMKGHKFTEAEQAELLGLYNRARGWDTAGRPEKAVRERLGLENY